MKVINATWEKRNLGVDTMEFELDGSETAEEIRAALAENEKEYNVVKVPAGNAHVNFIMTELGYTYIESLVRLVHDLKSIPMLPLVQRINSSVSYEPMNDSDLDELFSEISKGMFRTDRIAVDPHFSVDISNRRYINWIKDEISRGTEIFKTVYKNDTIAFFTYKKLEQDIYYPFLAGMYMKYISSGLGICGITKPVEESIRRNAKQNLTYVSTNNNSALTANLTCGYQVDSIINVFVKSKGV